MPPQRPVRARTPAGRVTEAARKAGVRLVRFLYTDNGGVTRGKLTHVENRTPGGGSNPYLVMAACVAAGIDGLKNKTEPPAETSGIAYGLSGVTDLPTHLETALGALEADTALRAALGEEFIKLFVAVKRHEIEKARKGCANYDADDFNQRVDPWEIAEFFEFL